MSEQRFTPGQWRLELSDDRSEIKDASGQLIAVVDTWMQEEKEANAALIAAAPDLLAALEGAYPLAIAHAAVYQVANELAELHPVHAEILDNVKQALAAAKGGVE